MLINWFTVLAQAVNFMILVLLLKRFLYTPIIDVMQQRQETIAARMEEAQNAEQAAMEQTDALKKERLDFQHQEEQMMIEARKSVDEWRDTALKNVRLEIDQYRQTWLDSIEDEKTLFYQKLRTVVSEEIISISRKVLTDLANRNLEDQLIEHFMEKIRTDHPTRTASALHPERQFLIRSGFPLDDRHKKTIELTLRDLFPELKEISYEAVPDVGFGIRMLTGDWKIEWNLDWYLQHLETMVVPTAIVGKAV